MKKFDFVAVRRIERADEFHRGCKDIRSLLSDCTPYGEVGGNLIDHIDALGAAARRGAG
jgi:hypothetical protein